MILVQNVPNEKIETQSEGKKNCNINYDNIVDSYKQINEIVSNK